MKAQFNLAGYSPFFARKMIKEKELTIKEEYLFYSGK